MNLTNEEAFDMLEVYFQCMRNATVAARVYTVKYPEKTRHSRRFFVRLAHRLRTTGNVHRPVYRRQGRGRTEQNVVNVLGCMNFNPHLSTRAIASDLGISRTTVQNILREHRLHPHYVILHQSINDRDFDSRLDYCNWLLEMIEEDPGLLSRILWSDKATFNSDGSVNRHNMHYWSQTNLHWMLEIQHQNRWSVNVWCGILGGQIIETYIFNESLNGERYLNFLITELPLLSEDMPLEIRRNMFFQHNGCLAHFSRDVRNFLDQTYPDRWIGRGSLFHWPARSPDLSCLDFYLWGRIKDLIFVDRPTTTYDMIERIRNVIRTLSVAEVETAVLSTRRRLLSCIENDGRHFEHLGRH